MRYACEIDGAANTTLSSVSPALAGAGGWVESDECFLGGFDLRHACEIDGAAITTIFSFSDAKAGAVCLQNGESEPGGEDARHPCEIEGVPITFLRTLVTACATEGSHQVASAGRIVEKEEAHFAAEDTCHACEVDGAALTTIYNFSPTLDGAGGFIKS
jgi:hypothetical protein